MAKKPISIGARAIGANGEAWSQGRAYTVPPNKYAVLSVMIAPGGGGSPVTFTVTDTTGAVPIIFSSGSSSPTASFKPIVLIAGQAIRIEGGGGGMVSGFEYDV